MDGAWCGHALLAAELSWAAGAWESQGKGQHPALDGGEGLEPTTPALREHVIFSLGQV